MALYFAMTVLNQPYSEALKMEPSVIERMAMVKENVDKKR